MSDAALEAENEESLHRCLGCLQKFDEGDSGLVVYRFQTVRQDGKLVEKQNKLGRRYHFGCSPFAIYA